MPNLNECEEVVTRYSDFTLLRWEGTVSIIINNNVTVYHELGLNNLLSSNWRESLVPAAAVIPAPIAYISTVAVKRSVINLRIICIVIYLDLYIIQFDMFK